MRIHTPVLLGPFVTMFVTMACTAFAQQPSAIEPPVLVIPRLAAAPDLADFVTAEPASESARRMRRLDRFIQRWPADGEPERMATIAWIGYTSDALHVVFQAFDSDPAALRAHLIRREDVFVVNDDEVEVRLDTYGDRQQSYYFVVNPLGVQLDASWPEVGGRYDESFDLVWHSRGERTPFGFAVAMEIPFKSLRFRPGDSQVWGIYVGRWIPRTGEWTFWPRISDRRQSFLSQMARLEGLSGISRGRGFQLIPYASSRAFSAVDDRGAGGPERVRDDLDPRAGVDVKLVVRDALVLDVTANPDFSQVESDAPQITANQRFELFFPEKRPFFVENAGFMQTPINLFFTRRIADPDIGTKLTGRAGPWTIAGLVADDGAPGARLDRDDPLAGARAWNGVGRVSRTLFGQSSGGMLVTRRVFRGRENTVAAADTRLRLGSTWTLDGQWAVSRFGGTSRSAGRSDGTAYFGALSRDGRTVSSRTEVSGRSPEFVTELGFVPRVDVHQVTQSLDYAFRPAKTLNRWGPSILLERLWTHAGMPLDWRARPSVSFDFRRSTSFNAFADVSRVTLLPADYDALRAPAEFVADTWGVHAGTSPRPAWSAAVDLSFGTGINYQPAPGLSPAAGHATSVRVSFGLRPRTPLRIENTWLWQSLGSDETGRRVFGSSIVRTQWAWQFTREWSLRFIGQYEDTTPDPALTTIEPRKTLNTDVLLTRLVNPWTALYLGFNHNARNRELIETDPAGRYFRPTSALEADAWQVFAKWSFLMRW